MCRTSPSSLCRLSSGASCEVACSRWCINRLSPTDRCCFLVATATGCDTVVVNVFVWCAGGCVCLWLQLCTRMCCVWVACLCNCSCCSCVYVFGFLGCESVCLCCLPVVLLVVLIGCLCVRGVVVFMCRCVWLVGSLCLPLLEARLFASASGAHGCEFAYVCECAVLVVCMCVVGVYVQVCSVHVDVMFVCANVCVGRVCMCSCCKCACVVCVPWLWIRCRFFRVVCMCVYLWLCSCRCFLFDVCVHLLDVCVCVLNVYV
jgi:hypothetical protein